ncbi:uncharacterized protein BDZ99DRAFT_381672 [Mytilinidion resinicola]|uniref:Zn(2)-C6 fungal-type domain-containing protein n=1 Tax=Mytilinidion resinicola TaxID=574789 RepID=A0A6A6YX17_9PEZI|nr:uncharacterized protein BDZ99DRAFT_381672 [Mytilinidion resinicola]KAF2813098.1 hypothetical protein BDZ99DRAFT_381672 [Mytilinidion resinicola]
MAGNEATTTPAADATQAVSKPKRVRTGCLTCRERHLKCDEALPICQNCKKSNRQCKRGIRLNFIDTHVKAPPEVPPTQEWTVSFLDESREIANEYKGGLSKYGALDMDPPPPLENGMGFDFSTTIPPPTSIAHQPLPPIQGILPDHFADDQQNGMFEPQREPSHQHALSHTESTYSGSHLPGGSSSYGNTEQSATPAEGARDYLDTQEEVLFMQVFVEEVGLWMDSMDPMKHFSRLLPFHALGEPMLLNAFLACGARHLALVNPKYTEDKALHYYDTATRYLLNSLQNPNRDTVICATTAVILNVYEIMCEKALQRMNHIAGARALIKECGWNARSTGIGAACFWLNVGMELLSCLHFNWQVAWDPDEWGVNMDFSQETESGREEIWTYRIVYIVAKVANFRATIPRHQEASPRNENMRLDHRYREWQRLKDWADAWNEGIPRTMHPMAYLFPGQTISQSAFPEVWLIKRTTIVARLFYHTCMCLLAQINPYKGPEADEMRDLQIKHSQLICGITAHVKDRGVASVALRSLAIAAECLTTRREQEEVLQIFDKIRQETGWRVGFLNSELKEKWGWNEEPNPANMHYQQQALQPQVTLQPMPATSLPPAPPARPRPPVGILNPLLATADFAMPQHPYQAYYVAPNPQYVAPNPLSQSQHFTY